MTEAFQVSELKEGRPEIVLDEKSRECFDFLDSLNIPYQFLTYNFFPQTAKEIRTLDEAIQVPAVKNLVFATRNKKKIFFFVLDGKGRFDLKKFREDYQVSKLHLLDDQLLEEILDTQGGAVSLLELRNDRENRIQLYLDETLLERPDFRLHPNHPDILVQIKTKDLMEKLIPALGHELHFLEKGYVTKETL